MARPRKTQLDYFPFDVGFFENEKIACIAGEFGIKGEIVAIRLLCAVYGNGYFLEWNDAYKMKTLRQMPGVSSELFDQILNRLVRWGFFDASLFDSVKVLTSVGIQKRYFEAVKFRKLDKNLPFLLIGDDMKNYEGERVSQTLTPVSQRKTRISQAETPQIKLNKKENKFSYPHSPQGGSDGGCWREKLRERFFSKQMALESFCMGNHISQEELRRLAEEVFDEWELVSEKDLSERHLINTLRVKINIRNGTDKQKQNISPSGAKTGIRSKLPPEPGYGLIED